MVSSENDIEERLQACLRKIHLKRNFNAQEQEVSKLEETGVQMKKITKTRFTGSKMKNVSVGKDIAK